VSAARIHAAVEEELTLYILGRWAQGLVVTGIMAGISTVMWYIRMHCII
jgi:hypothetical protein